MYLKIVILLTVISVVSSQINGEFWWLNKDLANLRHGTVEPPKFDDVNELDTDETAKVVFKDNVVANSEKDSDLKIKINDDNDWASAIHFRDETELTKIFNQDVNINVSKTTLESHKNIHNKKSDLSHTTDDEFSFVFPNSDTTLWTKKDKNESKISQNIITDGKLMNKKNATGKVVSHNKIASDDKDAFNSKSVCTFITKYKCIQNNGILYSPWMKPEMHNSISSEQIICCILPITTTPISKIIFPDSDWRTKRYKRSNLNDGNLALKQRDNLMSRKYDPDNLKIKATTQATRRKSTQKIVNSDEYNSDPYWNIKSSNIRNPDVPMYQDPDTGYDDESSSYGDDYTVELPKPGLIGLYSDHRQTIWTNNKNKGFTYDDSDSVEEEFGSFGYSSIDPRLDHRVTSEIPKPLRRRPSKLTATSSKSPMHNSQSQIISFHSNPDFQVLQGFKLLNLMRHKNRIVRKTPETEENCDNNSLNINNKPQKLTNNELEEDLLITNLKESLFKECGKTVKIPSCDNGKEQGVVEFGGHPWIALVVLTKSPQNVLCYATLVHTRVAVSAADCVYGQSPGAISIIAGVRNLDEALALSQRRMASIFLDSEYTPGNFAKNLALLHWKRPLTLDATVQPACLADLPAADNNCFFVGWGGYDQEMHPDLRWQRASMLTPQNCNKRLFKLGVNDALCVAVESRGTVTGVGGPLLCNINDRWSTVGVAVWRDDVVILLPPYDRVIRNMAYLRIE